MQYGEQKIDGYWYYFDKGQGAMQTGFVQLPEKTVYYDTDGHMVYGNQTIDGFPYYFNKSTGAMQTGWVERTGETYYYTAAGIALGQLKIDGYWYYFDETTGQRATGWKELPVKSGVYKTVYYNEQGRMQYGEQKIDRILVLF